MRAGKNTAETTMDNRINDIRRKIRTLRVSMLEAEAIMREQINRDEGCAFVAGEILKMRTVMSLLVQERSSLGDQEPICVNSFVRFAAPAGAQARRGQSLPRLAGLVSSRVAVVPRSLGD